jgi:hypothetical protein
MSNVDLPGFGQKRIVNLDGQDIVLDPANLRFSDPTLNQFFELVSGFCDYYGQKLADANRAVARAEQLYDRLYIEKFKVYREEGKSEKTSELYAKAEAEVVKAKTAVHEVTHKRDSVWNHLKALNAAREDAHNRGHFLRKELDKINMEVRAGNETAAYEPPARQSPVSTRNDSPPASRFQTESPEEIAEVTHSKPQFPARRPVYRNDDAEMDDLLEQAAAAKKKK